MSNPNSPTKAQHTATAANSSYSDNTVTRQHVVLTLAVADALNIQTNDTAVDFVTSLPPELALLALSFLNTRDLTSCSQVSKEWYNLCKDNFLWRAHYRAEWNPATAFNTFNAPKYATTRATQPTALWRDVFVDKTQSEKTWLSQSDKVERTSLVGCGATKGLCFNNAGRLAGWYGNSLELRSVHDGSLLAKARTGTYGTPCNIGMGPNYLAAAFHGSPELVVYDTTSLSELAVVDGTQRDMDEDVLDDDGGYEDTSGSDGVWALHATERYICTGSLSGSLKLWDVDRLRRHEHRALAMPVVTFDSQIWSVKLNTTRSLAGVGTNSGEVHFVDTARGHKIRSVTDAHRTGVCALAALDATTFISASDTLCLWDLRQRDPVEMKGFGVHNDDVLGLQVDETKIVTSCRDDRTLYVWDVRNGFESARQIVCPAAVESFQFSGSTLLVGDDDGRVSRFEL